MSSEVKMPEPVAVVCDVLEIRWLGAGPIAPLMQRRGIKVGCQLVTESDALAYADDKVREALESAAQMLDPTNPQSDWTPYAHDCADHAARIRALAQDDER